MKISWFQLIMADFDDRWLQKIAIFCNLFQSQAMRCKIRTRWAMRIVFHSSDTPRVIFLPWDHLNGGRKGVRSLSFGWLSSIKNWWNTYCNDLFELKANTRTPFRNIPDLKRYVNKIPLTWNTHFIDTYRLVTIKMKLHGSLRKNENWKNWNYKKLQCDSISNKVL